MADYCKQCSIELFGEDFKDLAELVTFEEEAKHLVATVMCEGRGPTDVNRAGECLWHAKAGGTTELCYKASRCDESVICC